jgi:hypothetical protein
LRRRANRKRRYQLYFQNDFKGLQARMGEVRGNAHPRLGHRRFGVRRAQPLISSNEPDSIAVRGDDARANSNVPLAFTVKTANHDSASGRP